VSRVCLSPYFASKHLAVCPRQHQPHTLPGLAPRLHPARNRQASRKSTAQSQLCVCYIHIDPGVILTNGILHITQGVIIGASLGGLAFLIISGIGVIYLIRRRRRLRPDGPAVRDTGRLDSIQTSRVTDLSSPKFGPRHRAQAQMPKGKNVTS
jgi:hypothetical protein